jgi:hypothetical protein
MSMRVDVDVATSGERASRTPPIGPEVRTKHGASWPRSARRICVASVIAALVPLYSALIGALRRGWIPIGDNAYFELRARDVFSHHFPFLGTWTSASQSTGTNVNNPGPLFFELLAVPVKLLNADGLLIGVVLINTAAVIGIAIVAHRRGGPLAATAAMAMTAGLTWTMGSELLFDPWQPHAMLLPFLLFLVLVWSLACGDLLMLPFTIGVSSLVLQTHLSYAILVPVLSLWGAGTLAWSVHRRHRADTDGWPALRRRVRRIVLVSAGLFFVLWLPPLIEEVARGRDGNLSLLLSTLGKPKQNIGWGIGSRLVASVLALPPWWLRPSFGNDFVPKSDGRPLTGVAPELARVPSLLASVLSLLVVVGVLALLFRAARRRADQTSVALLATAFVAIGGSLLTAATLPLGFFGVAPHQFRWLWPISLFLLFAALLSIARRRPPIDTTRITAAFAVGTLVLTLLNLPTNNQQVGPSADAGSIPSARSLVDQLGVLDGSGTLLFDIRGLRFAEPYSVPVINELDRRGVNVVVDDPGMVRQLGDGRRFDGHANGRIFTREADAALVDEPEPGAKRVAIAYGLSADQQRERDDLRNQISGYLASGQLRLTPSGHATALPADLQSLLQDDQIDALLQQNALDLDSTWRPKFERYAELEKQWDAYTVALFIAPVNSP